MPRRVMSLMSRSDSSRVLTVRPSPRARDVLDSSTASQYFGTSALAFLPEQKRLIERFFGLLQTTAGNRVADQGLLVGVNWTSM